MPTPLQVSMASHQLVFFNQYRQLCTYNTGTTSNYIDGFFILLKTTSSDQRWVSLKQNSYDLFLGCLEAPDLDEFDYTDYDFSDDAGQIWFDSQSQPSIVIGMGDIRDGIDTGALVWYAIPATASATQALIISCPEPFVLRIYTKGLSPSSDSVKATPNCPES